MEKKLECKNGKKTARRKERGYTLLEYCAGAAVIMLTVWLAMNQMGQSMKNVLDSIAGWADARAGEIDTGTGSGQGSGN